jgi:hypothetical protein
VEEIPRVVFVDESRAEEKLQTGEKYVCQIRLGGSSRPCSGSQFADHREHQKAELAVDTVYVVHSPHVKQAFKAQEKERFAIVVKKTVQDPHFQLPTSVFTQKLNTPQGQSRYSAEIQVGGSSLLVDYLHTPKSHFNVVDRLGNEKGFSIGMLKV